MLKPRSFCVFAWLVFVSVCACGQDNPPGRESHPNQQVRLENVPSLTADSTSSAVVLATALEIIFQDKAVCCGRNSALEDQLPSDPKSLKEVSAKLQGRHVLSDGRPITVTAEFFPASSVSPNLIVAAIQDERPLLVLWKSNFYVLYGAIYNETDFSDGSRLYAIKKLMLLDPRYSDYRREATFNRETDDWSAVEGLLMLTSKQQ